MFIGSGTQLVAPVTIGRRAYVAAGSCITDDVPPGRWRLRAADKKTKRGGQQKTTGVTSLGRTASQELTFTAIPAEMTNR